VPGFARNLLHTKNIGGLSAAAADLATIATVARHSPCGVVALALASLMISAVVVIGCRLATLIHLRQRGLIVREAKRKINTIDDAVKLIAALSLDPAGGNSLESGGPAA
jgi:hypothetical protein